MEKEKSKYVIKLKVTIAKERGIYDKKNIRKTKKGFGILARYRLGSETRAGKYWIEEEKKRCRLCCEYKEDIEHILEKCIETGTRGEKWIEQLERGRKVMAKMI